MVKLPQYFLILLHSTIVDETQVPPECDDDLTYVPGYTQDESILSQDQGNNDQHIIPRIDLIIYVDEMFAEDNSPKDTSSLISGTTTSSAISTSASISVSPVVTPSTSVSSSTAKKRGNKLIVGLSSLLSLHNFTELFGYIYYFTCLV